MKRAQNTRLRAVCFRAARSVAFFLLLLFSLNSGTASASPFEDSVRILEDRTAFHWGRDCFVWVVHYSEELVDPWVEAEAGRVGMSDSEREAYKNSFMSDLSMGEAEPLLVTVHAFGAAPLNLSPFSDKIALVTPSGERVKPVRYDRIFDQPLSGVVQGLIFFPKQQDPDFAVAMNGLGVFDERVFAFARENLNYDYPVTPVQPVEEETEVIIVELPPAPPPPAPRPQPPQPRPQPPAPRPQPPAPAPTPPPAPAPQTPPPAPVPPPAPAAAEPPEPEVVVVEPESPQNGENERDVAYSSREQTLRRFLDLWIRYDPAAMYLMLSDSSREALSRRAFEEELRKSADFRNAIRDGYTIDWTGSEQGKVVVIRRFLFIRTLLSRNFGLVREGSAWKIVW